MPYLAIAEIHVHVMLSVQSMRERMCLWAPALQNTISIATIPGGSDWPSRTSMQKPVEILFKP